MLKWKSSAALALCLAALPMAPAARAATWRASTHWVGAWEAPPSDASQGTSIEDVFAPSEVSGPGDKKLPVNDSTVRAILTPTLGGSTLRIHLSNRFGSAPITFSHVTIGKQSSGAALAGAPTAVEFDGKPSVTVAPGQDIASNPVRFAYQAFENLAVSIFVSGDAGMATEHYTARQTSYFTADGAGDHATDTNASAFTLSNSTRPFVDGIDVLAPASTGAVVAFGDSITDGYQGQPPAGLPANPEGLDANRRWPDDLARRLIAAHIPLSVLNAAISGNRVLLDGAVGGNTDTYGPNALSRLKRDVLDQAGVTTVIWLEGINDVGQSPNATAAQIEAGYTKGIAEMHAAGLKVLQGTLTPAGGDVTSSYGGAAANQEREQINTWIRTKSPADGIVDFDAAVRDPSDPSRINPAYDGGDHLHFNPAGYQAMANAINLSLLRRATYTLPALKLTISPRSVKADTRTVVRFRITVQQSGHTAPFRDAIIVIGRHRLRTNAHGRGRIALRFARIGHIRVRATDLGYTAATTTLRITRSHRKTKPR